jgi:cytochrome c biogenesis protein CcmG, thiol:disulfide interchange protein DsbE
MDYRRAGIIRRSLGIGLILAGAFVILAAGVPSRVATTGVIIPGDDRLVAPEVGAVAPPFTAPTLAGETVSLWALRGQPVVVNFWAVWCAPCRLEMPELQALHTEYGVPVLAVNLADSRPAVAAWQDEFGLSYPLVLDPAGVIARAYPRHGPPGTYLLDAEGVIRRIYYGPVTLGTLAGALDELGLMSRGN